MLQSRKRWKQQPQQPGTTICTHSHAQQTMDDKGIIIRGGRGNPVMLQPTSQIGWRSTIRPVPIGLSWESCPTTGFLVDNVQCPVVDGSGCCRPLNEPPLSLSYPYPSSRAIHPNNAT